MQKTKIEWVRNPDGTQGFTNNPVKGLCPVECRLPDDRIYCYGRPIYKRFHPDVKKPYLSHVALRRVGWRRKPAGIFMCSTFELFHPMTSMEIAEHYTWRDQIFDVIINSPQHRFYILTKFPQNIDRKMPENVWLGMTITGNKTEDFIRASVFGLEKRKAKIQFISYEPLLEEPVQNIPNVDWILIGRLTQHGHKYDPKLEWIKKIVRSCADNGIKVFLKDNLKEIWGDKLIQEFPKEIS